MWRQAPVSTSFQDEAAEGVVAEGVAVLCEAAALAPVADVLPPAVDVVHDVRFRQPWSPLVPGLPGSATVLRGRRRRGWRCGCLTRVRLSTARYSMPTASSSLCHPVLFLVFRASRPTFMELDTVYVGLEQQTFNSLVSDRTPVVTPRVHVAQVKVALVRVGRYEAILAV